MRKKVVGLSFAALFLISSLASVPASAETVEWSEPTLIKEVGEAGPSPPSIASNNQGWQVVAWSERDGSQTVVYANRFDPETGWGGAEALGIGSYEVEAGIDDAGNSTVIWTLHGTGVMVTRYVPMYGAWDEVRAIPGSLTESWISGLQLSVCGNGGAAAIWTDAYQDALFASTRSVGPSWSDAVLIQEEVSHYDSAVAMDDSRNAIVVYSAYGSIWAKHYVHDQGWSTGALIENQMDYSIRPSLTINGDGLAIAAWMARSEDHYVAFANVYVPELGWGVENPIEDPAAGSSGLQALAIDDNGNAVAAWRMVAIDGSYSCIRANLYDLASGWGVPTMIDDMRGGVGVQACAVTDGGVYVTWYNWVYPEDVNRVYANHFSPADGWVGVSIVTESTNLTGHSIAPNHLGGATIAWSGFYADWGIYISSCSGSGTVDEIPIAVMDIWERNNWKTWKFDGRESTDDGRIVRYLWDFGDGDFAHTKVAWHKYQKAGDYTVALTVWDNDGNSDSTSVMLSVWPSS